MSENIVEIIKIQNKLYKELSNVLGDCPRCKYIFWVKEKDLKEGKERDVEEIIDCGELQIGGEKIHAIDRIRIKQE